MANTEKVNLNQIDEDEAMHNDAGFYAFNVKTGNITDWHGSLLPDQPPYVNAEVVRIDEKTATAIEAGEIDRTKLAYAIRMGETVEAAVAAQKQKAKADEPKPAAKTVKV